MSKKYDFIYVSIITIFEMLLYLLVYKFIPQFSIYTWMSYRIFNFGKVVILLDVLLIMIVLYLFKQKTNYILKKLKLSD